MSFRLPNRRGPWTNKALFENFTYLGRYFNGGDNGSEANEDLGNQPNAPTDGTHSYLYVGNASSVTTGGDDVDWSGGAIVAGQSSWFDAATGEFDLPAGDDDLVYLVTGVMVISRNAVGVNTDFSLLGFYFNLLNEYTYMDNVPEGTELGFVVPFSFLLQGGDPYTISTLTNSIGSATATYTVQSGLFVQQIALDEPIVFA